MDAPGGVDPFTAAAEAEPEMLRLLAANVSDLERTRIAIENRVRQATTTEPDADGVVRGFGLDDRNPYVRQMKAVLEAAQQNEHQAVLSLQRAMRRHPLGPWVKAQRGVGEKIAARLLGAIGDPYLKPPQIREDEDGNEYIEPARPRRVSDLWSYCGLHVLPARQVGTETHRLLAGGSQTGHPEQVTRETHTTPIGVAPKRQKGQQANWNEDAKKRVFLIADSILKQLDKTCPVNPDTKFAVHVDGCRCGEFRKVYDRARERELRAVHKASCVRCGPAGAPAQPGSPLSDGHKHARALRIVGKEFLKALWIESRRLHTGLTERENA